ncbi:MAG: GH3 auxin-responsive promoter family protein [Syntrophorhabdaceae bacterium]|nr:GH3 auxin-responsive promoter family protein [Syntrophorhabdaceae bacterium]
MSQRMLNRAANTALMLLCRQRHAAFCRSVTDTRRTQESKLLGIVRKNKDTEYGRKYGFSGIKSVKEFRSKVPITEYEDYIPYISPEGAAAKGTLTSEAPCSLVPTSGSASPSKLIPYTGSLKEEFLCGIFPWIFNLIKDNPGLKNGKAYWSITPAGHNDRIAQECAGIGFEDDSEYLGRAGKVINRHLLAVPQEVCHIRDMDSFRYVTLLFLCAEKELAFISVWNPTFLTLLLNSLYPNSHRIVNDIRKGRINAPGTIEEQLKIRLEKKIRSDPKRADELEAIFGTLGAEKPEVIPEKIWPELKVISCWKDGNSAVYAEQLRRLFPNTRIEGKGLLATEAIVSFPYSKEGACILAIRSHFFEFMEVQGERQGEGDIKLSHELEKGRRYSVIVTTGGGLYRYRLFDTVEVVGFEGDCPYVRFVGREGVVSDLFGEKVSSLHVSSVLETLFKRYLLEPSFYIVAPERDPETEETSYTLFLDPGDHGNKLRDHQMLKLIVDFEKDLKENYNYNYCRKLGQLAAARLFVIESESGKEAYNLTCIARGIREGNIKPASLDLKEGWSRKFKGWYFMPESIAADI